MVAAAVSSAEPKSRRWIVNATFDRIFFLGSWLVPFALMGIYALSPLAAILTFALLDGSHVAATFPLTVFDKTSEPSTYRFYRNGILIIAAGAVLVSVVGGTVQFVWGSVFNYWGAFHIIRQHYGFLKLYQHRAGDMNGRRAKLEVVTLYSGLVVPWLFAQSLGETAFRLDHVFRLPIPLLLPLVLLVPLAGLVGALAWSTWQDAQAGRTLRTAPLAHIALAVTNWSIGAVVGTKLESVFAMVLFVTSFHDIQYHGVVWHVGAKRYSTLPEKNPLSGLFVPKRLFAYAAVLLFVGATRQFLFGAFGAEAVMSAQTLGIATNFAWGLNFVHYLIDGRMWQMRRNPQMRRDLELSAPRPLAVPSEVAAQSPA